MGVPKRKVSHAGRGPAGPPRTDPAALEACPHCHEPKLPHHVCPNCGWYRGPPRGRAEARRRVTEEAASYRGDHERPDDAMGDRATETGRGVRVAVDAMGGDHGPTEVVPARSSTPEPTPRTRVILVGDEATIRRLPATCRRTSEIVHASEVVGMDEHPAQRRPREEGLDRSSSRPSSSSDGRRRRGRHGRATPAPGWRRRVLKLGRLPGVDRPALAVQMVDRHRPVRAARHRREPGLDRPRTSPSTRGWARSSPSASSACSDPRGRAPVDRRGEGQGRRRGSSERRSSSTRRTCEFVGNVEGKDLPSTWPMSSSATRSSATS